MIVTGGGGGIGAALCRRFATEGAAVAVADRAADAAEKDKSISEDERDDTKSEVQDLTKKFETQVNDLAKQRESEVLDD